MHLTQERGSKTDTAHTLWLKKITELEPRSAITKSTMDLAG